MLEEAVVDRYVLEIDEVKAVEVIVGLKTAEAEAFGVPEKFIP